MKLVIKFGGYQEPASVHNRAGGALRRAARASGSASSVDFELIGSILKLGRPSGDLVPMVERGELSLLLHVHGALFAGGAGDCSCSSCRSSSRTAAPRSGRWTARYGDIARERCTTGPPCRLLGYWDNGFRHLSTRVRPIRTPEDCRGIRIRTQMSELHGEVFRALGFEPIASDVKEFVEQIAGERVPGSGQPPHEHLQLRRPPPPSLHHAQRALLGRVRAGLQRGALPRAGRATCRPRWTRRPARPPRFQRQLAAAEDAEILKMLDPARNDVIRLTDAERAAFMRAVEPVLAKYRRQLDPKLFAYLGV